MEFKKSAALAAVFTVAMVVINYLAQAILGQTVKNLFAISVPQLYTPTSAGLGTKIVGWLGGLVPGLDIPSIVIVFLTALVAIVIGALLVEKARLPVAKGTTGRIMSVVLWGTVPIYLLIVGMSIPETSKIFGVLVYTFIASYLTAKIAEYAKINV